MQTDVQRDCLNTMSVIGDEKLGSSYVPVGRSLLTLNNYDSKKNTFRLNETEEKKTFPVFTNRFSFSFSTLLLLFSQDSRPLVSLRNTGSHCEHTVNTVNTGTK